MFNFLKKIFRSNKDSTLDESPLNWRNDRNKMLSKLPHFNQRDIPACTAHSMVTMMQIEWYGYTGKMINFSPRFLDILSWTPDLDISDGRDINVIMTLVSKVGCCTEDLLPNDTTLSIEQYRNRGIITKAMLIEAAKYRSVDTGTIPTTLKEVDEIIYQSSGDFKNYYQDMEKLRKEFADNTLEVSSKNEFHVENQVILTEAFNFFEQFEDIYEESPYIKEKKLRDELDEKYKKIKQKSFFAKGVAARIDGFAFIVYSDDHDKHFHIIHKGRGVDARFSFPQIELLSYKNTRNFISSKEKKKFKEFITKPDIFQKFEKEFRKRE